MYIAFITGLISSLHCMGMCGPIALALPVRSPQNAILYNFGRISTYTVLGAIFGIFGKGLYLAGIQQSLSIILGILVVAIIIFPKLHFSFTDKFTSKIRLWFTPFFKQKSPFSMFMIGVLNGLLPCGMVYLAILGAIAMSGVMEGSLYMFLFGLGTLPMMLLVSLSKTIIKPQFRFQITKLIPVFTLCIGILFIIRGLNLGIAYVSPKIEKQEKTMSCCRPSSTLSEK
ncbi:sulfite exporter TauE/SafE family protein [Cytophagaceae bacterium YF14B1]|uniref:Sulfite exporter TauE/SafE family protein n=1 Tax=Xanthocytophaga flava TaxID=3048013 RepID=A0AAE3U4J7_9BACT|nr:sulfite exporter TauE/SafE family protein [Xanthocytophaga flavus]MDJ1479341.1 sulfite exporter TauE/SafE family protein [Xanthocytophaga flavus]